MAQPEKRSQEKHQKYIDFYKDNLHTHDTEYWGLGVENESYLMFKTLAHHSKEFLTDHHVPERYSVNYWKNYKSGKLKAALSKLPSSVRLPVYLNGYLFQLSDLNGEPITLYTKKIQINPKFTGETIDQYLKRVSPVIRKLFEKNMIYDGDTFEFTTFHFYKTTVPTVVQELLDIKKTFLEEINLKLVQPNGTTLFKEPILYPPFNYGFAKFQTNMKNVATCNNGTYHINITLPTPITETGDLLNPDEFKLVHANAIRAIQWIEPLLVGLYGSPDIMHILDPAYSAGSQRIAMSRYIGLGTYSTATMEKGKLLNTFDYKSVPRHYFQSVHSNSPYIPPERIGFDFNYNKFTKHGIELRIFDYFPEEYLESIMNLLVLVCQYSVTSSIPIPDPKTSTKWNALVIQCIQRGSNVSVDTRTYYKLYKVFGMHRWSYLIRSLFSKRLPLLQVMRTLSEHLYTRYKDGSVCKKLSPNMKPITIVDYNYMVKCQYRSMLKKH